MRRRQAKVAKAPPARWSSYQPGGAPPGVDALELIPASLGGPALVYLLQDPFGVADRVFHAHSRAGHGLSPPASDDPLDAEDRKLMKLAGPDDCKCGIPAGRG